jgi:cysteine synthase A
VKPTPAVHAIPPPVRTPLVRSGPLWIKAESLQRTKSAKYRMVAAKVAAALQTGHISEGTTLAEVTSGSTGVALAFVGKVLELPVELHAYRTMAPDKRAAIEELGGTLVLHPSSIPVPALLDRLRCTRAPGRYWHLNQYERSSTVAAYRDLGQELVEQVRELNGPPPQVFLCPVGTGGLIQGVGAALRSAFPGIRVVALEPEAGATIDGIRNTELLHQGPDDPYDRSFPDELVRVPAPDTALAVGSIPLGQSSTAAFLAASARGWDSTLILAPG